MNDHASKAEVAQLTEKPPTTMIGILQRLGPGLIVAGSIVGSGELIATTRTGAEAGFSLLWLILIGCVIKVFVQVEFGRYSIVNGKSTMDGLDEVPGPRIRGRGNWIVWYWFAMFLASMAQLGGIVGGVGQALAISVPLTEVGQQYNQHADRGTQTQVLSKAIERLEASLPAAQRADNPELQKLRKQLEETQGKVTSTPDRVVLDSYFWAILVTLVTSAVLVVGRYGVIQSFSTAMVCMFTLITIVNLVLLQNNFTWAITWENVAEGMSFGFPQTEGGDNFAPIATALATFGIIGVGASELVTYPYWCLEKGYAKFTGSRNESPEWAQRARGWMRVMHWDAWCSMFVYTFATMAFYFLGAAILGRVGLLPKGEDMIRTLSVMYEPVFGPWAPPVFLFGAFAVLYSTFFVANASQARVFADVLRVLGFAASSEASYQRRVRWLSGFFPLLCLAIFLITGYFNKGQTPVQLVLLSGVMQAVMLPMLAAAALYFRYYRCDPRVRPNLLWDLFLWISSFGMLIAGGWAAWSKLESYLPF